VQIAPSGMMKKRKDGFSIVRTPRSAFLMIGVAEYLFRLMSPIVSFVSWLERFRAKWITVRVKKTRQNKNLELRF
jgi:hypothetical protein